MRVLPINWTVGMVGILASTVEDALIVYAALSGEIPSHQPSSVSTKINLPRLCLTKPISSIGWQNTESGLMIAVMMSIMLLPSFAKASRSLQLEDVTIPDIEMMRLAHYITIGSECSRALDSYKAKNFAELGWDVTVAKSNYGAFSGIEYVKAHRIRNRQLQFHKKIFAEADVIVSPTTGVTTYPIQDDALKTMELHLFVIP